MEEDYAGAQQMFLYTFSTLGWKINRDDSITDDVWQEIVEIYLRDKLDLNIRQWFEDKNPYAFQGITETLLEAIRKEYWQPGEAMTMEIATAYAESVVRHGHSEPGELNEKLERFIAHLFNAPGPDTTTGKAAQALLAQYRQKTAEELAELERQETEAVEGQKMEQVPTEESKPTDTAEPTPPAQTGQTSNVWNRVLLFVAIIFVLLLIGAWRRAGGPK